MKIHYPQSYGFLVAFMIALNEMIGLWLVSLFFREIIKYLYKDYCDG